MKKLVFRVEKAPGGWTVKDGTVIGPFHTKEQALDLAVGMVAIVRQSGQPAELLDLDPATQPS